MKKSMGILPKILEICLENKKNIDEWKGEKVEKQEEKINAHTCN